MMKKSALVLLILVVILAIGCAKKEQPVSDVPAVNTTSNISAPIQTDKIMFGPGKLPAAKLGIDYRYSFCEPPISSGICGSSATNPKGGNPPYHFVLDSGSGFPPIGISLNMNGIMTGKASNAGKSSFRVCAVDNSGSQACGDVELVVEESLTGDWQGSYDIGVDVSAVCTNMRVMTYGGPIIMELSQQQDKLTGTGSISGVNNIFLTGTGECTPQAGGDFDMKITGSTGKDGSVILDMDFGDPDLYFPKLHFVGRLDGKELSGTIAGEGIAASTATLNKQ